MDFTAWYVLYDEILVENETTEQMNNETVQQVSEINRF
jgi:hypothetical protein